MIDDGYDRDRAALLRLLERVAAGGWQDEDGREVSPEVARDALATLRWSWRARRTRLVEEG